MDPTMSDSYQNIQLGKKIIIKKNLYFLETHLFEQTSLRWADASVHQLSGQQMTSTV